MKRTFFYSIIVIIAMVFVGCQKPLTLVITNPSLQERNNTLAEIEFEQLGVSVEELQNMRLVDEQNNEVFYQVMYYGQAEPQSIVFMVDNIRGGLQREFHFKNKTPQAVPVLCTAQFVPERKDDFAWENDQAAYRMYGPALADENPSNGVDLWLKCTDKAIVAQFYDDDLNHNKPYHVNYGEGLDCYKVAHTLGCGGIAPYENGQLHVLDHYLSYEILEASGLRVMFRLTYPTHIITITSDASALLNKAELQVLQDVYADSLSNVATWAAGIYLHDTMDNVSFSQQGGWAAYAENAVSDGGEPQGRNYCAIYVPQAKEIKTEDGHLLALTDISSNQTLTYWFGGGWSQWRYATDAEWFSAVSHFAHNALLPLQVTVKATN